MEQEIQFSSTGAHHQNGVVKRNICKVTEWAHTMLLHAILHWPNEVNLDLWPFAMDHAVCLWNHLPDVHMGIAPIELYWADICCFRFLKIKMVPCLWMLGLCVRPNPVRREEITKMGASNETRTVSRHQYEAF
jgi:hypothetical protein